jgi:hypothetical protein
MSTVVFDFFVAGDFRYRSFAETVTVEGNEGVTIDRPDAGPYGVYKAEFSVDVPGPGCATGTERTIEDWLDFLRDRQGAYDSWLWKDPLVESRYKVATTDTDGALGNGTGSQTDFALAHTRIDAATLLVYVNGALQTLTTHYTLEDNNTDAPYVAFVSAPGGGLPVTVEYEFYYPVKFATDPDDDAWRGGGLHFRTPVSIREVYAGAHRVDVQ